MTLRFLEPTEADIEAFYQIRRESLADAPLSFGSGLSDDRFSSRDNIRDLLGQAPDSVVVGAFDGEHVAGVAGLVKTNREKTGHKGFLWGMYVRPANRGKGLATAIVRRLIEHGASLGLSRIQLSVSSTAPAAQALYEKLGFVVWGTEPDALRFEGQSADEHHMDLVLAAVVDSR